jgi:asparagine synthase (glutamine-hydrolysing)
MCGIVGYSGLVERADLGAALGAMAHRGPDDSGVFNSPDGAVGLGHVRLSIRDLSPTGHQPMLALNETVALVFNGEIYNFTELREELLASGHEFNGHSDTEVLLHLYLEQGEAFLERLNGIFALGIWDARCCSLLLARDGFGVKPLYFAQLTGGLVFSSEIKSLLELAPSLKTLDPAALHDYMSFLWCPGAGTPLASVRKLEPGHAMRVVNGRIARQWTWYRLPVTQVSRVPMLKETEALEGTVFHLRNAVRRQLVADVPVGAFLSGGLDSSAIVAFAREFNKDIQCYTIDVSGAQDGGFADDLPYARKVASHLGVKLNVVQADPESMARHLQDMVVQLDEPLADPAALNVRYISALAREQGIKVLLSGAGGDDIFSGYRRHRAVQAERYWSWLPRPARSGLQSLAARLPQQFTLTRRISKAMAGAALDGNARLVSYFQWVREADLMAMYSNDFRQALGSHHAADTMMSFLDRMPDGSPALDRMLALEQRYFLSDHNLNYTDKMSMAVGLEVRVPFLDPDLVAFATRLPVTMRQHGAQGKWILKRAMEPYLPHDVIYRPKSGFGVPLRRWMRHDLRGMIGELLSPRSLSNRGIFDSAAVQQLLQANDKGTVDASYTLLSMACIEIWCRHYLDERISLMSKEKSGEAA